MEKWNKVLLSVFNKSRFQRTEVVERQLLTEGYNLLSNVEGWSTKVIVESADDDGIVTDKFTLVPGEEAKIEEYQTGEYSFMNGWSKMLFRLDGHTRPFLVISIINSWYDTNYCKTLYATPGQLDFQANISAMLPKGADALFPDFTARYAEGGAIEIDFEGAKTVINADNPTFWTPTRDFDSSSIKVYDEEIDIDERVKILLEYIP